MAWLAICLPLMVVGIAIATVPVLYATHHQHRYDHHEPDPHRRGALGSVPTSTATVDSDWTVCPMLHRSRRGSSDPRRRRALHCHGLTHRLIEVGWLDVSHFAGMETRPSRDIRSCWEWPC